MTPIAALPMYDWPEAVAETEAEWAELRAALAAGGVDAPAVLTRRNGDLPAVPGGIVDAAGAVLAPDPGRLPPDELDLPTLWRHPALLFAQSCWGPLEYGLGDAVEVIGQPNYDRFEGGRGPFYSSALVMRRQGRTSSARGIAAPPDGRAAIPLAGLEGVRLAYNSRDSMSGFLALSRDLAARGGSLDVFARRLECGSHRGSLRAVADGRADLAAIDCRSWALAQRFEDAAASLTVVGWTALRPGLPYITGRRTAPAMVVAMRSALAELAQRAIQPPSRRRSSG